MLTPTRLLEAAAWMQLHGVTTVSGVNVDSIHISLADMKRIAPDAQQSQQDVPYRCTHYSATISDQRIVAVEMDMDGYHTHQNR